MKITVKISENYVPDFDEEAAPSNVNVDDQESIWVALDHLLSLNDAIAVTGIEDYGFEWIDEWSSPVDIIAFTERRAKVQQALHFLNSIYASLHGMRVGRLNSIGELGSELF